MHPVKRNALAIPFLIVLGCVITDAKGDGGPLGGWDDEVSNPWMPGGGIEDSIPGIPGRSYPNYDKIPDTDFDCARHKDPGYYGDTEAQCQVFHVCQAGGRHNSFLCPLGTIFNQETFVCDWWFNVDCGQTSQHYQRNGNLHRGSDIGIDGLKVNGRHSGKGSSMDHQPVGIPTWAPPPSEQNVGGRGVAGNGLRNNDKGGLAGHGRGGGRPDGGSWDGQRGGPSSKGMQVGQKGRSGNRRAMGGSLNNPDGQRIHNNRRQGGKGTSTRNGSPMLGAWGNPNPQQNNKGENRPAGMDRRQNNAGGQWNNGKGDWGQRRGGSPNAEGDDNAQKGRTHPTNQRRGNRRGNGHKGGWQGEGQNKGGANFNAGQGNANFNVGQKGQGGFNFNAGQGRQGGENFNAGQGNADFNVGQKGQGGSNFNTGQMRQGGDNFNAGQNGQGGANFNVGQKGQGGSDFNSGQMRQGGTNFNAGQGNANFNVGQKGQGGSNFNTGQMRQGGANFNAGQVGEGGEDTYVGQKGGTNFIDEQMGQGGSNFIPGQKGRHGVDPNSAGWRKGNQRQNEVGRNNDFSRNHRGQANTGGGGNFGNGRQGTEKGTGSGVSFHANRWSMDSRHFQQFRNQQMGDSDWGQSTGNLVEDGLVNDKGQWGSDYSNGNFQKFEASYDDYNDYDYTMNS